MIRSPHPAGPLHHPLRCGAKSRGHYHHSTSAHSV